MYDFYEFQSPSCQLDISRDKSTSMDQSKVFDDLAKDYDFVRTLDYLPEPHQGEKFSPISPEGKYLMFDRHHLSEVASLQLVGFFNKNLLRVE
jgi:hypothetical protein